MQVQRKTKAKESRKCIGDAYWRKRPMKTLCSEVGMYIAEVPAKECGRCMV